MQWNDEGIVLGVKRHGEASAILELMTREHGRHLGLVRGGTGRMMRPVLQTGNLVNAVWRARLDAAGGVIERAVFKRFATDEGYPDGMALDTEGGLWIARWGART